MPDQRRGAENAEVLADRNGFQISLQAAQSKRPFRQTPVTVDERFFFRREIILRPVLRVFGALVIAGVIAQPELHFVLAPTAEEVVKPAASRIASGQMCRIAQAALP